MLVFGTRPEAIKMAPIIHELRSQYNNFEIKVCITAQHRQMLDQVLNLFEIQPDIDLNLMRQNQDLSELTASIIIELKKTFLIHKPDMILVHGDTTTTLATAMASFYLSIPVGHVEAGLRTYDLKSPFPEEFNRQVTSKIAKWHFAPTILSQKNLLSEGISKFSISVTGNTVIDSLNWILKRIETNKFRKNNLEKILNQNLSFDWKIKKYVLVTAHRRENFGNGFIQICKAIKKLALIHENIHFIFPVHLNPNVYNVVKKSLEELNNVHLIKPQDYEIFVYLLKNSFLVLTDSGGIQEEAPSLGKPVLVMRDITERPEAIEAGTVKLVGSDCNKIIEGVSNLIKNKSEFLIMSRAHNPYGDGLASKRIVDILRKNN